MAIGAAELWGGVQIRLQTQSLQALSGSNYSHVLFNEDAGKMFHRCQVTLLSIRKNQKKQKRVSIPQIKRNDNGKYVGNTWKGIFPYLLF